MSQENVDRFFGRPWKRLTGLRVRKNATEITRADVLIWIPSVETMDAEDRVRAPAGLAPGQATRGHDGVMGGGSQTSRSTPGTDMWRSPRCTRSRGPVAGVLALSALPGEGSGIEIEVPAAIVASFRNGLMTRFNGYGDEGQALDAAGLSE